MPVERIGSAKVVPAALLTLIGFNEPSRSKCGVIAAVGSTPLVVHHYVPRIRNALISSWLRKPHEINIVKTVFVLMSVCAASWSICSAMRGLTRTE
jgi:hypothetical protein